MVWARKTYLSLETEVMAWKVPAWMFSYDGDRTLLLNTKKRRDSNTQTERDNEIETHTFTKKRNTHKLKQTHTIYMMLYLAPPCSIHSFFRFWRRVRGRTRERFLFTLGATCTHIDSWTKRVMIHDITTFFASFRDRCCSGLLHGWGRSTELRMVHSLNEK